MDDEDLEAVRERKKRALVQEQGLGAPSAPVYVDGSQNFDRTVAAHDVVLVHYYADGGAGQRLHPVVESVARETFAAVAKVNVVHHQKLALERGIEGTPTFDLYADGEREERIEESLEKDDLVELVGEYTAL
ncbi:thioredoxin family protein [Halorussus sp. MSC15.2]|uniref:thioredoxin family protein n=1 Tax=Halorussus sp. MSC15.2 TaxID=2283638 RepID=UPI0013D8DD43|nr:thioredoxin family protein [Halorussus sp. MSC15.2]NEU57056.1 thioredoxin family protein [Halorussus sp. MSC15.2]